VFTSEKRPAGLFMRSVTIRTAVLFAREGAKVLAADINLDAAAETKRII